MAFLVSPGISSREVDLTTIVPGVATSTGAIAGVFRWGPVEERILIDSETKLVNVFGSPSTLNPETFFSAASFLAYANSLYVVRAGNTTTTTANSILSAVANVGSVANLASVTVKNKDHYDTFSTFDSNVLYIAKYPGALGNELRISVCDSTNAYESDVNLVVNSTVHGTATFSINANTVKFVFNTTNTTPVTTISNSFIKGDLIKIGNTELGYQYLKITEIEAVSSNSSHAYFDVKFSFGNRLSEDFVISNTVNGNTTVINVSRSWEFSSLIPEKIDTSDYVREFGNTTAKDEIHIVIVDEKGNFSGVAGGVLEVYPRLSRAIDAKSPDGEVIYYKKVLNDRSKYVWFANDRSGAPSANAQTITSSTNQLPWTKTFSGGTNGPSESAVPISTLTRAYDLFKNKEEVEVSLIIAGKPRGGTGGTQLANYLIDNIAESRKDCIVFLSPDKSVIDSNPTNIVGELVNWRQDVRNSTYAFIDTGYKQIYDRYNDILRYVPMNGDMAGLVAQTEFTNDAWWSPAGYNRGFIRNIVKLLYNPTQAERDVLYKNSINPVVSFPNEGTVLFGDKTATSKPSAFDRINVRRLFIVLRKAIEKASKYSLFEFNDEFTRSQFKSFITPFLRDVKARRGITDFLVVCDASNNTPERVDRNEFWADIYVKPARSINFIHLSFVAVRSGVEFNTVVGKF